MRKNPHVRICGGLGSATTLVYPTDQRRHVGLSRAGDQVALPMSRNRAVLNCRGALANRDGPDDVAARLRRRGTRTSNRASLAQLRLQRLVEHAAALHEQTQVDRFVRHVHRRIIRIRLTEPAGDLLGRPLLRELGGHRGTPRGDVAKRHRLGRRLRAHAAASAVAARYRRRPPCRRTSRLTVDGARRSWRLICRTDVPLARPREMASRSGSVSARRERWRAAGGIPPVRATSYRTTLAIRPSARPMAFSDSPCRHRRHSSVFCAAVKRGPRRCTMKPPH